MVRVIAFLIPMACAVSAFAQEYRLVYQTVYDQQQVTAYRVENELVYDEQR